MKTINERRIENALQLSGVQKYVLAKLVASETPLTAYEEVSRGANMVTASQMLAKLGLMTIESNNAEITEQGNEALQKEGLMDEMGELTEEGQLWGFAETPEEAAKQDHANKGKPEAPVDQTPVQDPMGGNAPSDTAMPATQDAGGPDAFSIESLEMIQGFRQTLKEAYFWKNTKS